MLVFDALLLMAEEGQEQRRSHSAEPQGQWTFPSLLLVSVGVTRVSFQSLFNPFYTADLNGEKRKGRPQTRLLWRKAITVILAYIRAAPKASHALSWQPYRVQVQSYITYVQTYIIYNYTGSCSLQLNPWAAVHNYISICLSSIFMFLKKCQYSIFVFFWDLNKSLKFQNLLKNDIWELLYLKSTKELLSSDFTEIKSICFGCVILVFKWWHIEPLTFIVHAPNEII